MNIFKQKDKVEKIEIDTSNNPYLNAKTEWLERYGDYITRAKNWQIVAIGNIIISFICVLFLGYIGSQNKLIPYVIEVDKLGNTAKVGIVQNIDLKNPNVIKYSLNTFIYSWRSIWGNVETQRKFIFDAYSFILPQSKAFNYLNSEYQNNNPFEKATKENVRIKVKNIVPQNIDTWQVEWEEITTNLNEEVIKKETYRGLFQIKQIVPNTEEQILKNPLGIFIDDFNFSKIL
ncbi:TPA: VirB8/TrbF family protein [Campylobacter jejuni]|uniref:VirB8/TrbF family protein n=1 Tax=Campylobacter sp. CNRCH_2016_3089 TaxID=2911609 RepID=UPI00139BB325|nr:VirB8/TrbF family protein [Campylobacter sp. CNRCH_2016_3089]EAI4450154.1 conjugal transfer protein TrbF [Campylobacter lari]EAI7269719.1 conjugal transfer protein TrbF [Campylobacter lari]EDP6893722.1 conjugal transfer protein TrbF [Campylobacter lari]MCV3433344.1 VirB8/TrbF family protein [Campylobacter lari]MCV3509205.1 VirB8/TrbF family protein [Campylobacter sp. CNRCH_2016_3089]